MKRILGIVGVLALAFSLFILAAPSTYAATSLTQRDSTVQVYSSKLIPNYTGGGCTSPKEPSPSGDVSIAACISWSTGYIRPDAYIEFRPNTGAHGQVLSCEAGVSLYEAGTDQLINNGPIYDCTVAAQGRYNNYHIYGTTYKTNTGEYYAYAFVTMHYSDGTSSTAVNSSPVIYL